MQDIPNDPQTKNLNNISSLPQKMHETKNITAHISCIRVPHGWIYWKWSSQSGISGVFVHE